MARVAVFCGSAKGKNPIYEELTKHIGQYFVQNDIGLVYGGGSIGLMGILADEIMTGGGFVHGVIPKKIYDWEVGHEEITELEVVDTMHERKARMADLSDAFLAIPGGIGTLDELIEILTWKQLGYHDKSIGLLNANGLFDEFISLLQKMESEGFLDQKTINHLTISDSVEELMPQLTEV